MNALAILLAATGIVSFKDANKIKSWDAWDDHKAKAAVTNVLQKEKKCVTWKRLNELDFGLKEIGRLATRTSAEVKSSKWSVGCETMDRDYAEWNSFKALIPMLGVKRARFFSGWAKTEQEKGVYDFTWLDPQIRECAAMHVKPWVCISYGNPVWGSDFRLGMRVKQVTGNPEAFDAWIRYTKALVARYKDVVDEWEVWNEPFGQGAEYAEMFYRTARAIREVQPEAKIFCTAISMNKDMAKSDYAAVLEKLKRENALDLGSYFIYHPYTPHPEAGYSHLAEPLRKFVKSYSGRFDILQGETGCPGQLEFAHAMNAIEWTEYSQAKWDLRRAIGDAVRAIPSSVFTMTDLQYTFMLQSYGLVRSNTLKEFVYRRPKWYAMRNVYALFDDETLPADIETTPVEITRRADPRDAAKRELTRASFTRFGKALHLFWYSNTRPSNRLEFDRVTLKVPGRLVYSWNPVNVVWVDMITGRVGEIAEGNVRFENGVTVLTDVPMWDSPILIASRTAVPLAIDWRKATPAEIVDSLYRPGQPKNGMKAFPGPHTNEAWLAMSNADFLPCFDRYGQFRHRDWPGKTKSDADLKKATEAEAVDLQAHPGPTDRNQYGGWKNGPKFEATGRFHTKKVDGKWWFVDPEGCLYWSFGPVRVSASSAMTPMNGDATTPRLGTNRPDRDCLFSDLPPAPGAPGATPFSKFWTTHDDLLYPFFLARGETRVYDFSSANLYRKYGEDYYEKFSDLVHRRLKSWGCNTIANSSDLKICLMDRTPYAERVECQSRPIAGSHGMWWKFRDPWDPSFAKGVTAALDAHGREAHDPWCIGFFIDNEINWGRGPETLAQWTLQSSADQPAKIAFMETLRAKYGEIAALNAAWASSYANWEDFLHSILLPGPKAKADLAAFTSAIVEKYFQVTRETVKAYDKGLLYLGCRFAGGCPGWVIGPCAKYCDVVSYNIYAETIGKWRLPQQIDAPVIIGEFHFGATDRGPFGTGVRQAKNQEDRAAKMQAYVRSALANPQMVGVHWHQFSDQATSGRFDGEYLQVGWTDICDTPYPIMRKALREVAYPLYETRRAATPTGARAEPVKVIFDTDMYTDFDDAGALACLHALADAGECEILATIANTRESMSVAMCEIINAYYGRPDIPVGCVKGIGLGNDRGGVHARCYGPTIEKYAKWVKHRNSDDAPDAAEVYRRILSAQPDRSVVICSVGFLTNMRKLVETDRDLVARKVKLWVAMACYYPKGGEFNSKSDAESSRIALEGWPTPIVFSDFQYGMDCFAGRAIAESGVKDSPVADVFRGNIPSREAIAKDAGRHMRSCNGMGGRAAWDETAVLAAVRGVEKYFNVHRGMFRMIGTDGTNEWVPDEEKGPHLRITEKVNKVEVGRIIDELICRGPRK